MQITQNQTILLQHEIIWIVLQNPSYRTQKAFVTEIDNFSDNFLCDLLNKHNAVRYSSYGISARKTLYISFSGDRIKRGFKMSS